MPKDMAEQPAHHDARHETTTAELRRETEQPTECGLTREELRALVVEMIG